MERRRQVRLRAVLLVAALYYLIALPVGYVYAEDWLGCCHFACCISEKPSPQRAIRSAIMLYVADNPRGCPTPEELVEERYLVAAYANDAEDIEIRSEEGGAEVIGPGPPAPALRERWRRRGCYGRWRQVYGRYGIAYDGGVDRRG